MPYFLGKTSSKSIKFPSVFDAKSIINLNVEIFVEKINCYQEAMIAHVCNFLVKWQCWRHIDNFTFFLISRSIVQQRNLKLIVRFKFFKYQTICWFHYINGVLWLSIPPNQHQERLCIFCILCQADADIKIRELYISLKKIIEKKKGVHLEKTAGDDSIENVWKNC